MNLLLISSIILQITQSYRKSSRLEVAKGRSFSADCNNVEKNEIEHPMESTRYKTLLIKSKSCSVDEQISLPNCSSTFDISPVIVKQFHSCPFILNELNDDNFCDLSTYLWSVENKKEHLVKKSFQSCVQVQNLLKEIKFYETLA